MGIFSRLVVISLVLFCTSGCTRSSQNTLWIYTSAYPHVVQELSQKLKQKFPDLTIRWYQAGSESVAAKVNAELFAGHTQADLILTSDAFWYEDLKRHGALTPYQSPHTKALPPAWSDPAKHFVTVRLPLMVIAYHADVIAPQDAPRSFADLTHPRFKDKVAMGSPLESGTMFTTVALLQRKYGWPYFEKLRANGLLAAGGNSAVMNRIETKERPVGIVLLENILVAAKKNPKIKAVYPEDGAILVPSPIAITKHAKNLVHAQEVYDFFFSDEAQSAFIHGNMYSPLSHITAPPGAQTLSQVLRKAQPWNAQVLQEVFQERDTIKKKFSTLLLE